MRRKDKRTRAYRRPLAQPHASPLAVLAVTSVVVLLSAILFWHNASTTVAADGAGWTSRGKPLALCGHAHQPKCSAEGPNWLSISSALPGDIAQVMTQDPMYTALQKQHGLSGLDLPALVHVFDAQGGSDYFTSDHWVVTARDASGRECGIFDFVYDRAHQRIRFAGYGPLTPSDPRYGHTFPFTSATSALSRLHAERPQVVAATSPELIFFPIDDTYVGPHATHKWTAGGESPDDPMWLVAGTDGQKYFVGTDGHIYAQSGLPIVSAHP